MGQDEVAPEEVLWPAPLPKGYGAMSTRYRRRRFAVCPGILHARRRLKSVALGLRGHHAPSECYASRATLRAIADRWTKCLYTVADVFNSSYLPSGERNRWRQGG